MNRIVLLFVLPILQHSGHTQEGFWVDLYGSAEGNVVKLYWDVEGWPQDLYGFNLKRRTVEKNDVGPWVTLNRKPLSPTIGIEKDWENFGLEPSQIDKVTRKFEERLAAGKIAVYDNLATLDKLKSADGLAQGDRMHMGSDFDLVLLYGFGYVDNTFDSKTNCEYGLFYVSDDHVEQPDPLAIYHARVYTKENKKNNLNLEVEISGKATRLIWKYAKSRENMNEIVGFRVYRRLKGSNNFQLLADSPGSTLKEDPTHLFWLYLDPGIDLKQDREYRVAAVNRFQSEFLWGNVLYEADKFLPIEPTEITELKMVNEKDIQIFWEPNVNEMDRTAGYLLECADSEQKEFKDISSFIPVSETTFVDRTPKEGGNVYSYRLATMDTFGKYSYSLPKTIFYLGFEKPPPIENLQAELIIEDEDAYVKCTWDPKRNEDTLTAGYQVHLDEFRAGKLLQLTSVPLITGNEYIHKITTTKGRDFTFKIVPISHKGAEGKGAQATCLVPLMKLPNIDSFQAEVLKSKHILLSWEYPPIQDLKGFRIFMHGQNIADADEVGRNVRAWIITEPETKSNLCNVQIQAIGQLGKSDPTLEKSVRLIGGQGSNSSREPQELSVQLVEEKEGKFAHLEWEKINMKKHGVSGYVLFADYAKEGAVMRMASLPLIRENQFRYKIDGENRKKFTFRVAEMDEDRKIGPYAEVTLDISKTN